jgi:oxaloacetate decarboxylase gamma subunit
MEYIADGISLLIIGMLTVFSVLFLVVTTGGILIRIVNKFYPINQPEQTVDETIDPNSIIRSELISAIIASVDRITMGKGKVKEIKRY